MSRDAKGIGGPTFVLLTCEHGGREVPPEFDALFREADATLKTHRGYDIGALGVAHRVAVRLAAPIIFSTVTRLLVDLNRSLHQPDLFSEFSRALSAEERSRVISDYYEPHRRSVRQVVELAVHAGRTVVHVGIHSCADHLNGQDRDLDIALLFDESRERETAFCEAWRTQLRRINSQLRYPFNQPYLGSDDGLTTTLRRQFDPRNYLGIEVELRQGLVSEAKDQRTAGDLLADSLALVAK